ncbi:ACT domain-containing protein [Parasulfuritortus cantonensis]|uniref:ACT domain-containing protein n=1 Tax=Parasulfuritortus cantonensis TaxID=2528202 RepID=A0A4R1BNH3_9PROT|nr:ACT domain-containing protein [Parasulfuritortus cantonensis]TCJ18938.1 ACT domain-containing protein [Parasulfuritortus cantonensis]
MKLPQLSVFLENRPGSLAEPLRLLADARINLVSISLADTEQFGILRLVLKDWQAAKNVLERDGWVVNVSDVVAVDVPDEPGGLVGMLDLLAAEGVNIEYMYAFCLRRNGRAVLIFRFEDPDAAIATLARVKLAVVADNELF